MSLQELLQTCAELELTLVLEGERIRVRGPQARLTAELKAALVQHKQALLVQLAEPSLAPRPADAELPLTSQQTRLFFLERLAPSTAYIAAAAVRFRGPLDVAALERALDALVARHPGLRTGFFDRADGPRARVQAHTPLRLTVLDRPDWPRLAPQLPQLPVSRPFALERAPLLRALLLRADAGDHLLVLAIHHLVTDKHAQDLFDRELLALYSADCAGRPLALPDLTHDYGDFALQQQAWLASAEAERQRAWWHALFADFRPGLELPRDRAAAPEPAPAALCPLALPESLQAAVISAARAAATTPFTVWLAGYACLLARYSGQRDLCIGTPVAQRLKRCWEQVYGFFSNTLALRLDLRDCADFEAVLARVRAVATAALDAQAMPLEEVVAAVAAASGSRVPLIQAALVVQPLGPSEVRLGSLRVEPWPMPLGQAKHDLTLNLAPDRYGHWHGHWEYDAQLFLPTTVARLADAFPRLLAQLLAAPRTPLDQLTWPAPPPALNPNFPPPRPPFALLTEAFAHSLARFPDLVALDGTPPYRYAELDARARTLALWLRTHGLGPGDWVAFALASGPERVIAMLGILMSGAAYLPLDPELPPARLAFQLDDAACTCVLADAAHAPLVRALQRQPQSLPMAAPARPLPPLPRDPTLAAYLIYTSGTSGRPKGVAVSHGSVLDLVHDRALLAPTPGTRFAQSSGPAFDVVTAEVWFALCHGGRLHFIERADQRDPQRFAERLADSGTQVLFTTTALFNACIDHRADFFRGVAWVGFGGEKASPAHLRAALAAGASTRLVNLYGPTEATTIASFQVIDERALETGVPLGQALGGSAAFVLDPRLRPVPPGAPGELCLAGPALARGYAGQPALSAARFVPNPFAGPPHDRLYRSGDLVRWNGDDRLVFLGRSGGQVKLRGYRIELEEIERVMTEHRAVASACALLADGPAGPRLVAAFVPSADAPPESSAELRAHLARWLPAPMVPSQLLAVASLPLTANGKLDRPRLLALFAEPAVPAAVEAPTTPLERALCTAFATALGLAPEQVGAGGDFFALGGHSLSALRLVGRLSAERAEPVPLGLIFEAPTPRQLAARLQHTDGRPAPLAPPTRPARLPLALGQERLWLIERWQGHSAAYHLPAALALTGPLATAALERSFLACAQRHESLRTRILVADGAPYQVIDGAPRCAMTLVDLSGLDGAARLAQAERLAQAQALRPFDLARAHGLRLSLLRERADRHRLVVVQHHLYGDGWSLDLLIAEVAADYRARLARAEPSPAPLPLHYADWALWQREQLRGARLAELESFWRETLAEAPRVFEWPCAGPRQPLPLVPALTLDFALAPALSRALQALASRAGTSLFAVLETAFAELLARWSEQDDFLIGAPFANRARPEFEALIGFFADTLVLRQQRRRGETVGQRLARAGADLRAALAHADLPFANLVALLAPERLPDRGPLVQVVLALQNAASGQVALPGLAVERALLATGQAKFDLSLALREEGDQLLGQFEGRADLFDEPTIRRYRDHFQNLLGAMVEAYDAPLEQLPSLTESERRALLALGAAPAGTALPGISLDACVLARAAADPEAVAVRHGQRQLSYAALAEQAQAWAAQLRAHGCRPGAIVAIAMKRSPELVATLLGVLHCGAAYLPLDLAHPVERQAFILSDSGCRLGLTSADLRDGLPATDLTWLTRPATASTPAACARAEGGDELAYLNYTSGTSGRPKAVGVTHAGVLGLLSDRDYLALAPRQSITFLANPAFDAMTYEVWTGLVWGGELHIFDREQILDLDLFHRCIGDYRTQVIVATTALVNACLGHRPDFFNGCARVLFGGEKASLAHVRAALAAGVGPRLLHLYGPTECTSIASFHAVAPDHDRPYLPIGRPIAATTAYVLDRALAPVPPQVPGELALGGTRLARGYLGRPALTAAAFVPDPFATAPGQRLYRTGDRVHWLPEGELVFLGRYGQQLKIRGFRIEPAEVRAVLQQHPAVADAVVLLDPSGGGQRLAAAVACRAEVDAAALRAYAAQHLPDAMVPSRFLLLEQLPQTANGKLDTRALQAALAEAPAPAAGAPSSATASALAEVWAELLELPAHVFADDDNFFERGGHSLAATKLTARIQARFGCALALADIFAAPRLVDQAALVDSARARALPPLQAGSERGALSFAQRRLWLVQQLEPETSAYHIPLLLELRGTLDPVAFAQAARALLARHEILRTRYDREQGDPILAPVPAQALALFEFTAPAMLEPWLTHFVTAPLALERGCQRMALLRLAPDHHLFAAVVHHIAFDAWSLDLGVRELASTYAAALTDAPAAPIPAMQYGDYAAWQQRLAATPAFAAQREHWRQVLAPPLPRLDLPPEPPPAPVAPSVATRVLEADLRDRLAALARAHAVTPFTLLLALFQLLLARRADQDGVVVGCPVSGRHHPGLENLLGCFLNTLPIRVELPNQPFSAWLPSVRARVLAALAHQDVPFETLVQDLNPERDLDRHPLFDAVFNYVTAPSPAAWPFLATAPWPRTPALAPKFTVELTATDAPDGLQLWLTYRPDQFSPSWARHLLEQYQTLAQAVLAESHCPLWSLPLSEARLVLGELCEPVAQPPELLAWLSAGPDRATALERGDQRLDRGQLRDEVLARAAQLRALGLGIGQVVAIQAASSPEQTCALLAVLALGSIVLLLDPELPLARRALMLRQSEAAYLLALDSAAEPPEGPWRQVPCLPPTAATLALPALDPDLPACIFFTSGSSGVPKAVVGRRGAIAQFIHWQGRHFAITPADRAAQTVQVSFDALLRDLLLPLAHGAALVYPQSGEAPAAFIARARISVLHTMPSLLDAWLGDAPADLRLPDLRLLFLTGEALGRAWLLRFRARFPEAGTVVHFYGATETTMVRLFQVVTHVPATATVPLGQCLPDTQAMILNRASQPCAPGEPGQIHLRTAWASLGYRNDARANALAFRPWPGGGRLYASGDRGRLLADGSLLPMGRLDQQFKLHGVRVEPGEIEAALLAQPGVAEAVVGTRPGPRGPRLLAWVTAQAGANLEPSELARALLATLPQALVPGAISVLPALPRTATGKLDRAALPEPVVAQPSGSAPETATELRLAALWRELLELAEVQREQDFFAAGGHSLTATRLVARLAHHWGIRLPLRAVFEHRTLAALAAHLERCQIHSVQRIARRAPDAPVPLSAAQRRLWLLDRLQGPSPAYNMPFRYRLEGPLDPLALEAAFSLLRDRHETLRCHYEAHGAEALQRLDPPGGLQLPLLELPEGIDPTDLARAFAARPFSLERGPLLRLCLVRLNARHHELWLVLHHIVGDGWSLGPLIDELAQAYAQLRTRPSWQPAPLPLQYGDYALWQRAWLDSPEAARQLNWWRDHLTGAPAALELGSRLARPQAQSTRGQSLAFRLEAGASRRLDALAQACGTTRFVVLAAVYAELLGRHAGCDELVLGVPVAQRPDPQLEHLIGFFVNSLPLRLEVGRPCSVQDRVSATRERWLEVLAHQDMPFERLVEALDLPRDPSRTPLFQVVLALQDLDLPSPALEGLAASPLPLGEHGAKFDLNLVIAPGEQGLAGVLTYACELFEADAMSQLLAQFLHLLEAFGAAPTAEVRSLSLFSPAERARLLAPFQAPVRAPRHDLVALFKRQLHQQPQGTAIATVDRQLTYAELAAQAAGLAAELRRRGCGVQDLVGVALPRSPEAVAAMLAIMSCGAVYLPLDPAYPTERLAFMIADSRCQLVIGQAADLPSLAVTLVPPSAPASTDDLAEVPSEFAAYAIYTSGSTGRPKGVLVPHQGLVNLIERLRPIMAVTPESHILPFASLNFDASMWELFIGLGGGARLCLAPPERLVPGPDLAELCDAWAITHLILPPVALAVMPPDSLASVTHLVVGGDVCTPELAQTWSRGRAFFNGYGPSESSVCVSLHRCGPERRHATPLGRDLDGCALLVLDAQLEPIPAWAVGELFIAGAGLALGYLARPSLTAAAFIPNPHAVEPGARLYRTGDLARRDPQGALYFAGRRGRQLKLRGFRIELGEIEAQLCAHPQVAAASVVALGVAPDLRLAAAVVAHAGSELTVAELRDQLARFLPAYMIPNPLRRFDALPLSPNGKVDRAALVAALESAPQAAPSAPPLDPVQAELAAIWSRLLGRQAVGIHDNFFALGGDSISAIQVISQAQQRGLRLSARQLFEQPTIAALAALTSAPPEFVSVPEQDGAVPLTPIQAWFLRRPGPHHHFNQALYVELPQMAPAVLGAALRDLPQGYDALRLCFSRDEHGWHQQLVASAELVLERVVIAEPASAEARIEAVAAKAHASFDLARAPLARALLFEVPGRAPRLLLICHHLIVDAVSWRLLLADLAARAQVEPVAPALPSASFANWARALAHLAHTPRILNQSAFWRDQRDGVALVPGALPGPVDQRCRLECTLEPTWAQSLLGAVARDPQFETLPLLLAGLAHAVAGRWPHTRRQGWTLELERHGREDLAGLAASTAMGWFTALVPLRLPAPAADPLATARAIALDLEALPDRGLGYGLLAQHRPELFAGQVEAQLLFNYLGQLHEQAPTGLRVWDQPPGPLQAPDREAAHLFELTALAREGAIRFGLTMPNQLAELGQDLLAGLTAQLRQLARCLEEDALEPGANRPYLRLPLSPLQAGLLHQSQHRGELWSYVVQLHCLLEGELDAGALARAWSWLLARHEILRTAFDLADPGRPAQLVWRAPALPWRSLDLTTNPEQGLAAYLERDALTPFRLEEAPLFRLALLHLGDARHALVFTLHHGILDGWSQPLLLDELMRAYRAFRDGEPPSFPAPPPFRRYLTWLANQDRAAAESYWRTYLAGLTQAGPCPLPQDGERYLTRRQSLSAAHTAALLAFCRAAQATPNALCQAALAALLYQEGGGRDLVWGAVVALRPAELEGAERILGPLIETVPVRADIAAETTPRQLLQRVFRDQSAGERHRHLGLAQIKALAPVGRAELFRTIYVFENYPRPTDPPETDRELRIAHLETSERTHYPFGLAVRLDECLEVAFGWRGSGESERLEALALRYLALLQRFVDAPDQPLGVAPERGPSAARPPHSATQRPWRPELAAQVGTLLGLDQVDPEADFFDLGGHSIAAIRLLQWLEQNCGRRIALARFMADPTVAGLSALLDRVEDLTATELFVPFQAPSQLPVLYAFHAAAGGIDMYRDLAQALAPRFRLVGVRSPWLAANPPSFEDLDAYYAEHLLAHQPQGPFHLCGWSLGGLLAHAVAARLVGAGRELGSLSLFDSHLVEDSGSSERDRLGFAFMLGLTPAEAAALDRADGDRLTHLADLLRQTQPAAPSRAELEYQWRAWCKHLAWARAYRPTGVRDFDLFQVLGDRPAQQRWQALGLRPRVFQIPGTHDQLLRADHLAAWAAMIAPSSMK